MNISVVVPVYNGAETLGALVERLGKVLPNVADSYEVILVNDGSSDDSWDVITRLSKIQGWVHGIDLMRNYGQDNALLCGIRAASHEVIVTLDDDLQNLPEDLPLLLKKLDEGFDVVYGVANKRQQPWWKNLAAVMLKRALAYVMGSRIIQDLGSYRVFRADLKKAFDGYWTSDVQTDFLLSWGTTRFAIVSVNEAPRAAGQSSYNLFKLVKMALLILTSYTTLPLRLASVLGFIFTIFGFFVLLYVLTIYFTLGSIPGFPFLASLIAIFSGVQLFTLGIIGEYLARMFNRSMNKPPYVIRGMVERGQ